MWIFRKAAFKKLLFKKREILEQGFTSVIPELSIPEAKAGDSGVRRHLGLHSESRTSVSYLRPGKRCWLY